MEQLLERYNLAERYFGHSVEWAPTLKAAAVHIDAGRVDEAHRELNKLPSERDLLNRLCARLKTKPVYKTLEKIAKDKVRTPAEALKGWCSLGTHIAIQLEHGEYEYEALLGLLIEKISAISYQCTSERMLNGTVQRDLDSAVSALSETH